MLHLFEPLGVGVGPSFLWAHTCMECWMYLNVFQIHIYAWNVECIWMCFEYTYMHGMLNVFECVLNTHICMECCLNAFEHIHIYTEYGLNAFDYAHMHGMLFECVWTHTYGRNMVWMCLNITHIARNIVSFKSLAIFIFFNPLVTLWGGVGQIIGRVNTISVSSVTHALASLFHDSSEWMDEWMDEWVKWKWKEWRPTSGLGL